MVFIVAFIFSRLIWAESTIRNLLDNAIFLGIVFLLYSLNMNDIIYRIYTNLYQTKKLNIQGNLETNYKN